jgi:hypothetical protein
MDSIIGGVYKYLISYDTDSRYGQKHYRHKKSAANTEKLMFKYIPVHSIDHRQKTDG